MSRFGLVNEEAVVFYIDFVKSRWNSAGGECCSVNTGLVGCGGSSWSRELVFAVVQGFSNDAGLGDERSWHIGRYVDLPLIARDVQD